MNVPLIDNPKTITTESKIEGKICISLSHKLNSVYCLQIDKIFANWRNMFVLIIILKHNTIFKERKEV